MSRHSASGSYGHRCIVERSNEYVLSWWIDTHSSGSRLRFPRVFRRDTNLKGATRFCKKWGLTMPEEIKR